MEYHEFRQNPTVERVGNIIAACAVVAGLTIAVGASVSMLNGDEAPEPASPEVITPIQR